MTRPDPILRWFDDETFFSLCSRQHQFLGHLDTSSTLEWLYGSSPRSISHDFPSNLSSLDPRVTALWGEPTSIIYDHTILPLLIPFQCRDRIDNAVLAMKSPAIGSMKYSLGLVTGRFGAEHPLKACTSCMREDRLTLGVAYWHLSHQYPGVVLCPIHEELLKECIENRQWSGRFKWVLPSEELFESYSRPYPSDVAKNALKTMSEAVLDLVSVAKSLCFDPDIVSNVYKDALVLSGAIFDVQNKAVTSFAEYASLIQPYSPYTALPTTPSKASAFIAQLTRKARSRCHPLKHLVLITWIFGRLKLFIDQYDVLSKADSSAKLKNVYFAEEDPRPTTSEIRTSVSRRPKKLKPKLRTAILESLKKGAPKDKICSEFKVSISTVNRLLSSDQLVKRSRQEKQLSENLCTFRAQWDSAIKENSHMSTNDLRSSKPNLYAWLYRNDRDWLLERNSELPCGRLGNYTSIDWDKRDVALQELILSRMRQVYGEFHQLRLCKLSLYNLVPSLSRSLEKRTHYPKTRLLIRELLQNDKG